MPRYALIFNFFVDCTIFKRSYVNCVFFYAAREEKFELTIKIYIYISCNSVITFYQKFRCAFFVRYGWQNSKRRLIRRNKKN